MVEESRGKGKSKSPRRGVAANCGRSRAGDMRVKGRSHMRLTAQGVACCGAKGAPPMVEEESVWGGVKGSHAGRAGMEERLRVAGLWWHKFFHLPRPDVTFFFVEGSAYKEDFLMRGLVRSGIALCLDLGNGVVGRPSTPEL